MLRLSVARDYASRRVEVKLFGVSASCFSLIETLAAFQGLVVLARQDDPRCRSF